MSRERPSAQARRPVDTVRVPSRSSRSQTLRLARPTCTARETFFAVRSGISIPIVVARASPQDVAALVEKIEPDSVTLTIVNTSTTASRRLIVQMGAYGEHQAISVRLGDRTIPVDASHFEVQLAAGAGERLVIGIKRLVNDPTLRFPWERR